MSLSGDGSAGGVGRGGGGEAFFPGSEGTWRSRLRGPLRSGALPNGGCGPRAGHPCSGRGFAAPGALPGFWLRGEGRGAMARTVPEAVHPGEGAPSAAHPPPSRGSGSGRRHLSRRAARKAAGGGRREPFCFRTSPVPEAIPRRTALLGKSRATGRIRGCGRPRQGSAGGNRGRLPGKGQPGAWPVIWGGGGGGDDTRFSAAHGHAGLRGQRDAGGQLK